MTPVPENAWHVTLHSWDCFGPCHMQQGDRLQAHHLMLATGCCQAAVLCLSLVGLQASLCLKHK
jgi:hypothetical protein